MLKLRQRQKQDGQRSAIGAWEQGLLARESGATVVILGDTNNSSRESLYGLGNDAGELNGYAPTYWIVQPRHRRPHMKVAGYASIGRRSPNASQSPSKQN